MSQKAIKRAVSIVGGQSKLARSLGISRHQVWQWTKGLRPVSSRHCLRIEGMTSGVVTCQQMRPDVFGTVTRRVA